MPQSKGPRQKLPDCPILYHAPTGFSMNFLPKNLRFSPEKPAQRKKPGRPHGPFPGTFPLGRHLSVGLLLFALFSALPRLRAVLHGRHGRHGTLLCSILFIAGRPVLAGLAGQVFPAVLVVLVFLFAAHLQFTTFFPGKPLWASGFLLRVQGALLLEKPPCLTFLVSAMCPEIFPAVPGIFWQTH